MTSNSSSLFVLHGYNLLETSEIHKFELYIHSLEKNGVKCYKD